MIAFTSDRDGRKFIYVMDARAKSRNAFLVLREKALPGPGISAEKGAPAERGRHPCRLATLYKQ